MQFSILKRFSFMVRRVFHIVVTKWRLNTKSMTSDCICGGNPCKVIRIIPE